MLPSASNDTKKEGLKDVMLGLHWAATTGNVGLVKFALDHGVPINSVVNGLVPLQLACISDSNIAVVQYLIDRGADVDIQKWSKKHSVDKTQAVVGATGSTALHIACANNCVKVVDLLIRNHAHVDIKNKYGVTPLDIAFAKHETEIIQLLRVARLKQDKGTQYSHQTQGLMLSHDEANNTSQYKKDSEAKTHKRSISEKTIRIRRPSMPSIFEVQHHYLQTTNSSTIPGFITMTPSNSNDRRRSFSVSKLQHHRDEESPHMHSCPITPRASLDHMNKAQPTNDHIRRLSRSSLDSNSDILPVSPTTTQSNISVMHDQFNAVTHEKQQQQQDWYGYGVVHSYEDSSYIQSLERRAYNLPVNEERHSFESSVSNSSSKVRNYRSNSDESAKGAELRQTALKNAMTASSAVYLSVNGDALISHPDEDGRDDYDSYYGDNDGEEGEEESCSSSEQPSRLSEALENGELDAESIRYQLQQCSQSIENPTNIIHKHHHESHHHHRKSWFSGLGRDIKEGGRHSLDNFSRKSLDLRPNFDHLALIAKRGVDNIRNNNSSQENEEDSSDDDNHGRQEGQKSGFFSRWTPAWSRK